MFMMSFTRHTRTLYTVNTVIIKLDFCCLPFILIVLQKGAQPTSFCYVSKSHMWLTSRSLATPNICELLSVLLFHLFFSGTGSDATETGRVKGEGSIPNML